MNTQLLECPHCGNKTQHEIIFQVDSTDIAYTVGNPDDTLDIDITYSLVNCTTCQSISMFVNTQFDENPDDLNEAILCYPHEKKVKEGVPDLIVKNYAEARKVMKISRPAFAILIRRGLEFICLDQNASGNNLKEKLDDLSNRGIIPSTLAQMANALRFFGNLGAHATDYEIDIVEAETMNEFFLTMIEFVYIAPAKLAKLRESIKKKTKTKHI